MAISPKLLEEPEGQVPLDSPWYIERPPIEQDCCEALMKPSALIRIKAPRQMGKSSLISRLLHYGSEQGFRTVCINFQLIDREFLTDLDLFLQWFCGTIANELGLDDQLTELWQGLRGSKIRCTNYFQRYLLAEVNTPLVLGLDEADEIFQYPQIAADFFALLRAWHEKGKNELKWQQLRLVIAHSKEVYIPLNINQSPFNVGLPVELPELNEDQIIDLIGRHELDLSTSETELFIKMLGGHPYLVRVALYQLVKEKISLEQFLSIAVTEEGCYYDHLRRHLGNLQQDEALLSAINQVIAAEIPIKIGSTEAFKLKSMGLVKFVGNEVTPLCELYRIYLQTHLQSSHKKDSEEPILAAIVFTDVVNSTVLMLANQKIMKELLKRDFQLMTEICQRHQGQVLKNLGDGLLMYFDSAVKAVTCAMQIQQSIAIEAETYTSGRTLKHRIGIHLAIPSPILGRRRSSRNGMNTT